MAFYGINCRASNGFVTDGANDSPSIGSTTPVTGPGGHQHSWDTDKTTSGANQVRDRSTGVGPRLAGIAFQPNGGSVSTLTVSLPDGAGVYNVRLAVGDASGAQICKVVVKSGGTTLITVNGTTSAAGRWFDSDGVEYTDATWPSSSPAQVTFSGATATIEVGDTGGSGNSALSHVAFEFVSGGGASNAPRMYYMNRQRRR